MVLDDKTNNRFLNFVETIIESEGVVVRCIFDIINTRDAVSNSTTSNPSPPISFQ